MNEKVSDNLEALNDLYISDCFSLFITCLFSAKDLLGLTEICIL